MSTEKGINGTTPAHTEEYYESIAGQEEESLEEGVEKLREREVLVYEMTCSAEKNLRKAEGPDQEIANAAEELVVGDSDDPPLSDETIVKALSKPSDG